MDAETGILDFFNDVLFFDGIETLMLTFHNNEELLDEGYHYISEHSCYLKEEMISDSPNAQFSFHEITKNGFFTRTLIKERHKLFKRLTQDTDLKNNTYNLLNILYRKANSKSDFYFSTVFNQLNLLIKDLRIYFPNDQHSIFNILSQHRDDFSYFQYKDIKGSFFRHLYEETYKLDLIDDVETSEEMFISTFTCSDPSQLPKVTFIQPNDIIAYFFKKIEIFFHNFNPITIENSQLFCNKQGKVLKSNDLYVARKRPTKNAEYHNIKIDKIISKLQKQYLA